MSRPDTGERPVPPDTPHDEEDPTGNPDTLQAAADRLFAEHRAHARMNQRRAAERERTMNEARARQAAAHTAHDAAAATWEQTIEAHRAEPDNLTLVASLDQAEATYHAACAEAERVNRELQEVCSQVFNESHADTEALLELGRRARAAQDAWFLATTPSKHGVAPSSDAG